MSTVHFARSLTFLLCMLTLAPLGCDDEDKCGEGCYEQSVTEAMVLEQCPQLCADALATLAQLGCAVECEVDIAYNWEGDLNAYTIIPLLAVSAEGSGSSGSCDLEVACDDLTECASVMIVCLNEGGTTEFCMEQFEQCDAAEICQDMLTACTGIANGGYTTCVDSGGSHCGRKWDSALDMCQCSYDACMNQASDPSCEDSARLAALPAPVPIGAETWDVTRAYVDAQVQGLARLDMETFVYRADVSAQDRGIALRSVDQGDTLYSLGFREGDVIVHAEGQPIGSLLSDPSAIVELLASDQIDIGVQRDGQSRSLRYHILP